MNLGQILNWVFDNLELVIVGLVLLSTFFNLIGSANKAARQTQKRLEAERERARQRADSVLTQREANPSTQSFESYLGRSTTPQASPKPSSPRPAQGPSSEELKDLQAEILAALGMKNQASPPAPVDPQAELRRKLAEKMARPATPSKPVQSSVRPRDGSSRKDGDIQVYLDSSRPERLENDSMPDTLGHSKRQPHFDLPPEPSARGVVNLQGNIASISRPNEVNAVQGIGTGMRTGLVKGLVDPRNAAQGIIWAEVLGKPRSRQPRR